MDPLEIPERLLMGPGPSPAPASVLSALGKPTVGHLDPVFLDAMDQTRAMLRVAFGTNNVLTLPMSGTGSAGMETVIVNLVEPGDRVLTIKNGVFGTRMAEVARRAGAEVIEVEGEWGRAIDPAFMKKAAAGKPVKVVCVVHAETSTGVLQPLEPMRELANELGALLLVDAVTSLGGIEVSADARGLDAVYSGSQKCLSCPPGLSPVTLSSRAEEVLAKRKSKVQSWYLDLGLIGKYWGSERVYHHTAPVNMIYALHEALRLVVSEGLEERERRHRQHARALWAGLEAMGLELIVPIEERLPQLTSVRVPSGVDDARVRKHLLDVYSLEIGGGLGPMKGNAWRIGLMGHGATRKNVMTCLVALSSALQEQGHPAVADPIAAALAAYGT